MAGQGSNERRGGATAGTSRRSLLRAAVGVAALSPGLRALGQRTSVDVRALRGPLHVLTAGGVSSLALATGGEVLLVDGGSVATSEALLAAAAALPDGGPVRTLFNTHWHPEHTGANVRLGAEGAMIVAQQNTRLWLTTDVTWPWNGETVQSLPAAALPNKPFYTRDELAVAGRRVLYGHLPDAPHTDGDLYVHFPDDNVLAVGGAVSSAGWQMPDWWTGGWIGGIVGGLDHLLTLTDDETLIVPSEGPVIGRAELRAQYDMYGAVFERLARLLYSGHGPAEAVAEKPAAEFEAKMGPAEAFVDRAFRSLWAYLSPDA